jgi:hypothetical protein
LLDAAATPADLPDSQMMQEITDLSLMRTIEGHDPENDTAFAEVFPPLNFAKAIEKRQPELLERFRCLETRQAVVRDASKLIRVSDWPEELYHLADDPLELTNLLAERPGEVADLNRQIERLLKMTQQQKNALPAGASLDLEADEQLVERLRGLGYVE